MVTPGLLPEADDQPPLSPLRWTLALAFLALIGLLVWSLMQSGRLGHERDLLAARLAQAPPPPKEDLGRIRELEAAIAELKKAPAVVAPARPPELRILPPELAAERLTQGLHEFRSGRYPSAEACFLRAVPEGHLYLVLTCLARGDLREAALFLGKAMEADPGWLRRVRPRDLFGSAEEFERTRKAVEDRSHETPLDPEAKLLLAYLHYHEKGAEYAKALVLEVVAAQPEQAVAKAFLSALEKP